MFQNNRYSILYSLDMIIPHYKNEVLRYRYQDYKDGIINFDEYHKYNHRYMALIRLYNDVYKLNLFL